MATDVDYDQIVRDSTDQRRKKFPDRSEDELQAIAGEEVEKLRNATVQDYRSVLTVRSARKGAKVEERKE